jgi:hypothetical protein
MSELRGKPGEIWSLNPRKGRENELAPLVLLHAHKGGIWQALPLLDDEDLACDRDVRLMEDFDWLNGVNWCAARDAVEIADGRLLNYLKTLDPIIFGQVKTFAAGRECSLPSDLRLLPDLSDPRITARREFLRQFTSPVLVRIRSTALRLVEAAVQQGMDWIPLDLKCGPAPLAAGNRGAEEDQVDTMIELAQEPYRVTVRVTPFESGLALEITASEAASAELHGRSREISLDALGEGHWVPADPSLPRESYELRLSGPHGGLVFDLDLD